MQKLLNWSITWNEIYNTEIGNNLYIVTEMEGNSLKDIKERIICLSTADLKTGRRYIKGLERIEVKQIDQKSLIMHFGSVLLVCTFSFIARIPSLLSPFSLQSNYLRNLSKSLSLKLIMGTKPILSEYSQ